MKRFIIMIWTVLLLILLNSCNMSNLDFSKLSEEANLNPSLVAPLAKANITGWDLFKSAYKEQGSNGVVRLVYTQNDLIKYNVHDLMNLPAQQKFSSIGKELGEISPGDVSISRAVSLSELITQLGGGIKDNEQNNGTNAIFPAYSYTGSEVRFSLDPITEYTSITLSSGTIEITLENKLKIPVTIIGSLFDTGNNRKIMDFSFTNILSGTSSKESLSLVGLQLSNKVEFRLSSFQTPGSETEVPINLSDYLKVTFDLKNLKISSGNVMVKPQILEATSGTFGFVFPESDMKAFSAVLKKGTISIKTVNSSKLNGTINLVLNEMKRNGAAIQANIPLNGSSTSIDLTGAEINFSSDPLNPFNQIPYTYSVQVDNSGGYINFASTDMLKMDISLDGLDFQSLNGDFGSRKMQIDPGNFVLDVLQKLGGDFVVANPALSLILHNSIGMPAEVSLNMKASSKSGRTGTLQRNPGSFNIPVPADIQAGTATATVEYNRQNSNIIDFMALPPNSTISYNGEIDFNKGNVVTPLNPNFLNSASAFSIDLALDIPMELKISTLSFNDTTSITGSSFNKVESAELTISASNGIPLDLDMQLFFVDTISKRQYGTSKSVKILSAAQISAAGEYIPVQSTQIFSLDQSEMVNLRKANGVVFSGTVISPAGKDKAVSILSTSKIDLKVVMKSKINL